MMADSVFIKVVGFVYKSLWIKINQTFRNFGLTNGIHKTNLLKTSLQIESTIGVIWRQVGFVNHDSKGIHGLGFVIYLQGFVLWIVGRIHEDFLKQVEYLENWLDPWSHEPNLLKSVRIRIRSNKSGFVTHKSGLAVHKSKLIVYESMF